MRRVSLRELLEAPVGRCVAGAHFLYFYPSDALCGFSLWGRPDVDDMSRLVEALRVELGRERHVSLVDAGGVEAVDASALVASAGSVVLLSPGGTSFDEFIDFAERGERFKKWVLELS